MNYGLQAIDRELVAIRGLQRVESGSQDRTSDDYCAPASELEVQEVTKRQFAAFGESDLADEVDGEVLQLVKAGFHEAAGRLLAQRMNDRIGRRVAFELS